MRENAAARRDSFGKASVVIGESLHLMCAPILSQNHTFSVVLQGHMSGFIRKMEIWGEIRFVTCSAILCLRNKTPDREWRHRSAMVDNVITEMLDEWPCTQHISEVHVWRQKSKGLC